MTEETLSAAIEKSLDRMVCDRIGEVLGEAISEWDVRHVIREVLSPVVQKVLAEELAKPEHSEMLREAIVGALKRGLPSIRIEIPNRHY